MKFEKLDLFLEALRRRDVVVIKRKIVASGSSRRTAGSRGWRCRKKPLVTKRREASGQCLRARETNSASCG
jgi:hypothetical protein